MIAADRTRWAGSCIQERQAAFKKIFIPHDPVAKILQAVDATVAYCAETGEPQGMMVIAETGSGKSTLCAQIHHRYATKLQPLDVTLRPVVIMQVPKPATPVKLARALLRAIGDPLWDSKQGGDPRDRAIVLLKECKTRIILVDNFHDVPERRDRKGARTITNWYRDLVDDAQVVMVLLGIRVALKALEGNEQMERRFTQIKYMDYFDLATADQIVSWKKLLVRYDRELPLAERSNFDVGNTAGRLFVATNGVFDYLMKLLRRAMSIAVARGSEKIEMADLKIAFDLERGDILPGSNPFDPAFKIRNLDRPGEAFERRGKAAEAQP
jgi:hypothetical protein